MEHEKEVGVLQASESERTGEGAMFSKSSRSGKNHKRSRAGSRRGSDSDKILSKKAFFAVSSISDDDEPIGTANIIRVGHRRSSTPGYSSTDSEGSWIPTMKMHC